MHTHQCLCALPSIFIFSTSSSFANEISPFLSVRPPSLPLQSPEASSSRLHLEVRFLKPEGEEMSDTAGRLAYSTIMESGQAIDSAVGGDAMFYSQGGKDSVLTERHRIGFAHDRSSEIVAEYRMSKESDCRSEMEQMKEKFAKLLLGEDMSGCGKGVSSALALSNAITNLAASVFSEQRRLEPMPEERKARWRKEISWLLSITDHIVEFVPSQQTTEDGTNVEIMVTKQRRDLQINIPALKKLDAMLLGYLDNFKDQNEFWYVSKDAEESENGHSKRNDDKWWLPVVKVPPHGLSEASRKWLHFQKESVNQVLKAAMAINAQVLTEMEIPEAYIASLPKKGKESLGYSIYRSITDDAFDPVQFLKSMDLSTEHKVLDLKNRIEASIVIWKRKMHHKDGISSWVSGISSEKREQFEERAETILVLLKQRFPGIPQSALDTSKIQYNKDVGQSILESYSRILESLASTVMSQIEDVLYADSLTEDSCHKSSRKQLSTYCDSLQLIMLELEEEMKMVEANNAGSSKDTFSLHQPKMKRLSNVVTVTTKKFSYLEKLENVRSLGSPTSRH